MDFINNVADQGELIARVQTHLNIRSLTQSLKKSNEELITKQKNLDNDLHAAAMIQRSFLPSPNFKISNLNFASLWLPANPLGGDIFNTIECDPNKIICYMIDVSGHDVPSALVTVSVSQYLHQQNVSASCLLSPKQMMVALDKEYPLERFDRYFTIFYMVFDISTGTFSYSCAGHPPAILLSPYKTPKLLCHCGPIIGLNLAVPFEEGEETLTPGDKLVIYTDGVTDVKNRAHELYGADRLYALLETIKNDSVEEIIRKIKVSLNSFADGVAALDDISIMCFEFNKFEESISIKKCSMKS